MGACRRRHAPGVRPCARCGWAAHRAGRSSDAPGEHERCGRSATGRPPAHPDQLDPAPRALDGRSILPFARRPRRRRLRPLLHATAGQGARGRANTREGATRGTQPRVPAWSAVRTTRCLYIEYKGGQRELYDLRRDRWQLESAVRDPRLRVRVRTLRRILGDLKRCRGRACDKIASASVRAHDARR
jgi:hypothetical protein